MAAIETFFEYVGNVGEGANERAYTYTAQRFPGTTPWFMMGRYMVDFDGAPNCYHPNDYNVLPIGQYPTVDIMSWTGALDWVNDAKAGDGSWSSVVLDGNGDPIVQGANDPFPGFYISRVPLQENSYPQSDTRHWADARVFPFFAIPTQILGEAGPRFRRHADGHTGNFGDYVTAINTKTGAYCHGLIGDAGNKPHFGEGSYALGKGIGRLDGTYEPEVLYIIYPHTGAGQFTIPAVDAMTQYAETLYQQFGGEMAVSGLIPTLP